ncbi:MAG TPA: sigma factor-like helix-turn-helix DNA-binding protein, partial [Ktedonobacterales bacterium]
ATNLASNHRRHRSIHDATMAHISTAHPATLDPSAGIAESAVVRAALLAMPVRQRSALVLRVVYGLSIPEIAEALGASRAATAMTLSRAREAFRAQYMQEETR